MKMRMLILLFIIGLLGNALRSFPFTNFSTLVYCVLVIGWGISVQHRLISEKQKRLLLWICGMMLLFFLLKMSRYTFFIEFPDIQRFLWYLYYLPMLGIPLFLFLAALSLEEDRTGKEFPMAGILYVPMCLLLLGILTNDFHQRAFRFPTTAMDSEGAYERGVLHLLAMLWIGVLLVLALALIVRCCSLSRCRHLTFVPLLSLVCGLLYMLVYVFVGEVRFLGIVWLRLPEAFCLMILSLWEGCLRIGLLRSNTGYERLFAITETRVQLAEDGGCCRYRSGKASHLSLEEYRAAEEKAVMEKGQLRLASRKIPGGRIYWEDDLSEVSRIHDRLVEATQQLENENALIRMQNEWLSKKSALEKKNQLYDALASRLAPWLVRMESLLDKAMDGEQFAKGLFEAAVYGAYVKRRSNLFLLAGEQESLALEELYLSVAESLEYLRLRGISCEVFYQEGGKERQRLCPANRLLECYDEFERRLEEALPQLTALLVRVSCEEGSAALRMELAPGGKIYDVAF